MFSYWKARRAAKAARRQYELALLEGLMADNQRRLDELAELRECRWCAAMERQQPQGACAGERRREAFKIGV